MLRKQADTEIAADLSIADPLHGQRLAICLFVEIAVRAAKGGNHANLAIQQILSGTEPIFSGVSLDRVAIDQSFQNQFQLTAADEFRHGKRGIFLPKTVEAIIRSHYQIGSADLFIADHGDAITACDSTECAGAGNVCAGKGEGYKAKECQRNGKAEFGLEEVAEELEHDLRAIPSGCCCRSGGPERVGALYPPCDP